MSIVNFKDNNRKKNFLKLIFTLILFLIIFKKIDLSETYHLFRLSLEVFLYLTFIKSNYLNHLIFLMQLFLL